MSLGNFAPDRTAPRVALRRPWRRLQIGMAAAMCLILAGCKDEFCVSGGGSACGGGSSDEASCAEIGGCAWRSLCVPIECSLHGNREKCAALSWCRWSESARYCRELPDAGSSPPCYDQSDAGSCAALGERCRWGDFCQSTTTADDCSRITSRSTCNSTGDCHWHTTSSLH